jgi:hypothetical protein
MVETAAPTLTAQDTTVAVTAHANPLYPLDVPVIRVSESGESDPVTAAIGREITEAGSVFLELPDGRLTVVLHLDDKAWIARARDEGIRG